jgi:hypothetical protein
MKELCSSTESALGSILNWRKGLAAPEEGCEERRTNPTPFRVWLQIVGHMSSCRIVGHPELRAIRNVWSAAILQAKNEDDRIWSARMYPAFVGVAISWPEWNALRSRPF